MVDLLDKGLEVIFGVIALILAATAIATTNAGVVGTLAWIVLGFVVPLLGLRILKSMK